MVRSLQVPISRETNDISFGLTLSKEINEDDDGKAIVIETIVIDSPAYSAGVMAKDILVAIDGHKIESLKQAAKMIKNKIRYFVKRTSGVFVILRNFKFRQVCRSAIGSNFEKNN